MPFRPLAIARSLAGVLLVLVLTTAASGADVRFLVRTGTDSSGHPLFRLASSQDTNLTGLLGLAGSSRAIQQAADFSAAAQIQRFRDSLVAGGASRETVATAVARFKADPVFIQVTNSASGSYNDWTSTYSVDQGSGAIARYSGPRVVFSVNSDVVRSGDSGLIEQTLVHEIAHGIMAQAYGAANLPKTALLGQAHSGGAKTDEQLALIEGWAEFVGAELTGRMTVAQDPGGALESNWYGKNEDGTIKSVSELYATEGWVATVLHHIVGRAQGKDALAKLTAVMAKYHPHSLGSLLQDLVRENPELAPAVNGALYADSGGQAGEAQAAVSPATGAVGRQLAGRYTAPPTPARLDTLRTSVGQYQTRTRTLISGMVPGLIGGAVGGAIGYAIGGKIGAIVGGLGGFLLANYLASTFLGRDYTSQGYGAYGYGYSPFAASSTDLTGPDSRASATAGAGSVPAAPGDGTGLLEAWRAYRAAFTAYQEALHSASVSRLRQARSDYEKARAAFLARRSAGSSPGR
ncbi:MAG: hypothetical protein HY815_16320 [Candidatus Riflebacteria bacterium]|nr:hypothetical protein [Candidatus Riflebacteria bacterium]